MGKGRLRIGKEHHAKARHDQIKALFLGPGRRVRRDELGFAQQGFAALAGAGQQRLRNVEADGMAGFAHGQIHRQRGLTRAAADIEHKFAGLRIGRCQQRAGDGRERGIHALLHQHPGLTNLAVPIVNLFGVRHR